MLDRTERGAPIDDVAMGEEVTVAIVRLKCDGRMLHSLSLKIRIDALVISTGSGGGLLLVPTCPVTQADRAYAASVSEPQG